jgi:hypothetical protein
MMTCIYVLLDEIEVREGAEVVLVARQRRYDMGGMARQGRGGGTCTNRR